MRSRCAPSSATRACSTGSRPSRFRTGLQPSASAPSCGGRSSGALLPDEPRDPAQPPRAVILGCAGERLSAKERRLFAETDPLGFVLFRRNCGDPAQVRALGTELRRVVGRADAPGLIDQEGGRVQRLQPPYWRAYPAAAQIAALRDPLAEEAAGLAGRLIAEDLAAPGFTGDG